MSSVVTSAIRAALVGVGLLLAACGGRSGGAGDAGGGGGNVDAAFVCGVYGAACAGNSQCCSGVCDSGGTCGVNPQTCSGAGTSCAAGTDCCSGSCVGNVCASTQCVSDGAACTSNDQCCGGACGAGGTCTPLNPTCRTSGNACTAGDQCCSQLCDATGHCSDSSYCVQTGDACAHDEECCGGICTIGAGSLGTCTVPMPGATNCSAGVDGSLCNDCGDCCSRLCAPYAATGVKICQPAEGCRINGDLCRKDSDCCGAAGTGLPGDGNVTCEKEHPTDPVGICRNPRSCNPEGNICHYKDYATCGNSSARNDCCGAVGNSGVCQLDALGVPRCYGLGGACRMTGETCAFSGDCCDGAPCVPDPMGQLRCGSTCSPAGGPCSATADCCPGQTCNTPPGSVQGTCGGGGGGGGGGGDAGVPDGGAGTDGGMGGTTCSQYGQTCNDQQPCCAGTNCNVTGSSPTTLCPPGQTTGCTCYTVIF